MCHLQNLHCVGGKCYQYESIDLDRSTICLDKKLTFGSLIIDLIGALTGT